MMRASCQQQSPASDRPSEQNGIMSIRLGWNVVAIILFHAVFIDLQNYFPAYQMIKYICVALVAICLLFRYRCFSNRSFFKVNLLALLFGAAVMVSAWINLVTASDRVIFRSLLFVACFWEVLFFCEQMAVERQWNMAVRVLFSMLAFYLLINDVMMFLFPALYLEHGAYYLIGNKFTVSYSHILLWILYMQKGRFSSKGKHPWVSACLAAFTGFVCVHTGCTTALIGLLTAVVLMVGEHRVWKLISNEKAVFLALLISSTALLLFSSVLLIPNVRYILVDILHKDVTLTGRTYIYSGITSIIAKSPIWGFGFNNEFDVIMKMIHAPNAQNGFLSVLVNFGIVGATLYMLFLWQVMRQRSATPVYFPLIVMIYVYMVMAMVEITLSLSFLLILCMVVGVGYESGLQPNNDCDAYVAGRGPFEHKGVHSAAD